MRVYKSFLLLFHSILENNLCVSFAIVRWFFFFYCLCVFLSLLASILFFFSTIYDDHARGVSSNIGKIFFFVHSLSHSLYVYIKIILHIEQTSLPRSLVCLLARCRTRDDDEKVCCYFSKVLNARGWRSKKKIKKIKIFELKAKKKESEK